MPFDGAGNFTRSYSWAADKAAAVPITAARMDGEFDNFAAAVNGLVLRSGVVAMTGNFKMGGFLVTGLGNGAVGAPSLTFTASTTTGVYSPAANEIAFAANGVQRFRAHATGVVTTGTSDTNAAIRSSGAVLFTTGAGVQMSYIGGAGFLEAYDYGAAAFKDLTINSVVVILGAGRVLIGGATDDGASKLQAAGVIAAQGIKFPASQVASADPNTLDDFEKGTFTPSLTFGGASVGITYNQRRGVYRKIADLFFADIFLEILNVGSSVGAAAISGIPFQTVSGRYGALVFANPSGNAFAASSERQASAQGFQVSLSDSTGAMDNTNFVGGVQLGIAGSYPVS